MINKIIKILNVLCRTRLCSKSVYTVPMDWMGNTIRNSLSGQVAIQHGRVCPTVAQKSRKMLKDEIIYK